MQERRNSSALAMELHISRTNPSIYTIYNIMQNLCHLDLAYCDHNKMNNILQTIFDFF